MKNVLYLLLALSITFITSSCQKEDQRAVAALEYANQRLTSINENWQEQTIDIATALEQPKATLNDNGATIITYYDADCSSCLSDLNKWKKTFMPFFEKSNPDIEFRFVLKTGDRRILDYNLQQIGISQEEVIIDTKNKFLETFDFADEKAFNTFLVNKEKEVVFIGSPLISDNLKEYYATQIAS